MSRVCSICVHSERDAIDRDLLAGVPNRRIAAQRAVSEQAIRRHRKAHHLPARVSLPAGLKARTGPANQPFRDRNLAREAARAGGLTKARKWRAKKGVAPPPFAGTILDAMDAAEMVGPSFDRWRTFWRAVSRCRWTTGTGRRCASMPLVTRRLGRSMRRGW